MFSDLDVRRIDAARVNGYGPQCSRDILWFYFCQMWALLPYGT